MKEQYRYKSGEIGRFTKDMQVGMVVVKEQFAAVSAPLVALFGEGATDHFINQISELGTDLIDEFGDAYVITLES